MMEDQPLEYVSKLFFLANEFNWDDDFETLYGIILDPNCDQATALLIFWLAKPIYYTQFTNKNEVPSYSRATYRLIKIIEEKFLKGEYKKVISFDPTEYIVEYDDIIKKTEINPVFYQKVEGIIAVDELKTKYKKP